MKRLALLMATAALAACGQSQTDEAPAAEASTAAAPIPTSNASPGTYEVTAADGTKTTSVLNDDHTYVDKQGGQETEAGSWTIVGGKTCFTPSEGANAVARCYTDGPIGADGTFTATPDQGDPIKVKKVS